MKQKYILTPIIALLALASCTTNGDLPIVEEPQLEAGVKMQVVVNMPKDATTRATDANALDGETKANTVLVAVFSTDNQIRATYLKEFSSVGGATDKYETKAFEANALKAGETYRVYTFVNPYEGLDATTLEGAFNGKATFEGTLTAITSKNDAANFFMSNANTVETSVVPAAGGTFEVATIVERAVARFDYAAGGEGTCPNTINKYTVQTKLPNGSTTGVDKVVKVNFTDYKLINTSKSFFNLRRVNDGSTSGAYSIGGAETATPANYVVDTDWAAKSVSSPVWENLVYSPLKNTTGVTVVGDYAALSTVAAFTKLSYVTENTVPANVTKQKGMVTAIVFKGMIDLGTNASTDFGVSASQNEPIYVWNNSLYGVFDRLPEGVKSQIADNSNPTNAELIAAGVTQYKYDATYKGYPMYYVSYIKHRDDNNNENTGPMEYAVVRNHVYKIKINSVSMFGHPNDPQDDAQPNADPDPESPDDEIESDLLRLNVTTTVKPWVEIDHGVDL